MAHNHPGVSERNPERNHETGEFSDHYPDDEFLAAVRERELPTTTEVADAVGCNRRTAYVRLNELNESGTVTSRRVGNTLVWSVVDDE